MIKCLNTGDLYCTRCRCLCDTNCYTNCHYYRGFCTTCEHFDDESGYCDDCFDGEKWKDKYIHGGVINE